MKRNHTLDCVAHRFRGIITGAAKEEGCGRWCAEPKAQCGGGSLVRWGIVGV